MRMLGMRGRVYLIRYEKLAKTVFIGVLTNTLVS